VARRRTTSRRVRRYSPLTSRKMPTETTTEAAAIADASAPRRRTAAAQLRTMSTPAT
jgi:hypothetical protein